MILLALTLFNAATVRLVDETTNTLFRGNIPRNYDGSFAKEALIKRMNELTPLPEKFELLLFSLLTYEREEETDFIHTLFKTDPIMQTPYSQGDTTITWWQVRPHLKTLQDRTALDTQVFSKIPLNFPKLIQTLIKLMDTPSNSPKVIYIHCRHGRNRTGATCAAYLMEKYNLTLEEVWQTQCEHPRLFEPHELQNFLNSYLRSSSETSIPKISPMKCFTK